MAELVTLEEDGPLGKAGDQVWVNDAEAAEKSSPRKAPAKKQAAK